MATFARTSVVLIPEMNLMLASGEGFWLALMHEEQISIFWKAGPYLVTWPACSPMVLPENCVAHGVADALVLQPLTVNSALLDMHLPMRPLPTTTCALIRNAVLLENTNACMLGCECPRVGKLPPARSPCALAD